MTLRCDLRQLITVIFKTLLLSGFFSLVSWNFIFALHFQLMGNKRFLTIRIIGTVWKHQVLYRDCQCLKIKNRITSKREYDVFFLDSTSNDSASKMSTLTWGHEFSSQSELAHCYLLHFIVFHFPITVDLSRTLFCWNREIPGSIMFRR